MHNTFIPVITSLLEIPYIARTFQQPNIFKFYVWFYFSWSGRITKIECILIFHPWETDSSLKYFLNYQYITPLVLSPKKTLHTLRYLHLQGAIVRFTSKTIAHHQFCFLDIIIVANGVSYKDYVCTKFSGYIVTG